jgi:release factor glutamine methyltransferase
MRIDAALASASNTLKISSESPRLDAEVLLAVALDLPQSYLYAHPEDVLDDTTAERFFALVQRRCKGLPLAYITGDKEFWSLRLAVSHGVLVPRPETELLVELALQQIPQATDHAVLELGTGSGAIALALASERPGCSIVATDISSAALTVARQNARQLGFANVEFLEGDWTRPVVDRGLDDFDLIVSNPPYIGADEPALTNLRFEPDIALVSGSDGLDAIRVLARDCGRLLKPGAVLLLEHGASQREDVEAIFAAEGWSGVRCFNDFGGRPRVTRAENPPASGATGAAAKGGTR